MAITMNIILHELEDATLGAAWNPIRGKADLGRSVEDVRIYDGGPLRPSLLYVFEPGKPPHPHDLGRFAFVQAGGTPLFDDAVTLPEASSAAEALAKLQDILMRYRLWEEALDACVIDGKTLQDVLDASSAILKNNIVVVDPALKLLAWTRDVPCDDPITVELINHGYHTEDNIKKFKLNKRFEPWAAESGFIINTTRTICRYDTVVYSFKTKRSFSLIVVMMCNEADPEPWLLDAYSIMLRRIGFFARRDYPDDKPAGNAADLFLRSLFSGQMADESVIRERSRFAGIPFKKRFCLFCIETDESKISTSRLIADVSRQTAPAKTILLDDVVAVLCFNCQACGQLSSCHEDSCPLKGAAVSRRLERLLDQNDLACGRSSEFECLTQTRCAFQQAKAALEVATDKGLAHARLSGGESSDNIICFEDCLIEHLSLLGNTRGERSLITQSAPYGILERIAGYDREHRTDHLKFLFYYLHYERRASVISERLHMHRNNVKYRSEKLAETFGVDLSDPALRFSLMVAFRLFDVKAIEA